MNGLLKLKPFIGSGKTLVISASAFDFGKFGEFQDQVFIHHIPGSRLAKYDPRQGEILHEYVEGKSCSQIIFVGSNDNIFTDQIENGASFYALKSTLIFNLKPFLRAGHQKAIDPGIKMQMLNELNVINQCKLLMDYFFIKDKVEKNKLQVRGVVIETKSDQFKSIFHNGVVYNDILSLN